MTEPADLLVRNIGQLVTCEPALGEGPLGVIERGAVAAAGGRICWIGPDARLDGEVVWCAAARVVDAGGRVALPGFVDSHTHLVFAGSREHEYAMRARGATYQEIAAAASTVRHYEARGVAIAVRRMAERIGLVL